MASIFDQIVEEDRNAFLQSLEEASRSLEKDLNMKIEAFNKYIEYGDDTELKCILGKVNENLLNAATTKSKRKDAKALTELNTEDNLIKIKIEKDIMPAPTDLPLKKRIKKEPLENKTDQIPKRSTRTRTKQKNIQEEESQEKRLRPNSDVIIQEKAIPTIEVPEDSEPECEAPNTRQTRSKRKQTEDETKLDGTFTVPKKKDVLDAESLPIRSTRTKTLRKNNVQETAEAKKEDELKAASGVPKEVEVDPANTTYVAKSNAANNNSEQEPANNEIESTPAADKTVVVKKPVVAKKNIPETVASNPSPERKLKKNEVFSPYKKTPLKDKVAAFENLRKTPASENKNNTPAAVLRKGTMLKIQSESIKKKRELKHQRAQQTREILAKEKMHNLEILKKKDEKLKNSEIPKKITPSGHSKVVNKKVQQTSSISSQSSSSQSNRVMQQTVKKPKLEHKVPLYMTTPMPLLPTADCYDSDDEQSRKMVVKPTWSRDSYLTRTLQVMECIGESLKNTLFCRTTHTPDLLEIFESIHPTKLKRNSSAVWRSPPRYTLFSVTREIHFSEDEESTDYQNMF